MFPVIVSFQRTGDIAGIMAVGTSERLEKGEETVSARLFPVLRTALKVERPQSQTFVFVTIRSRSVSTDI